MPPFPKLAGPAVLSPMAGVTDVAFRALCKAQGAALTCTEFVSSTAVVRGNERTEAMLATDPIERPVAVQLFGASVDEVVAAARLVEDRFDVIDINCGCPVWKVVRTGAGSALLEDPQKIARFVSRLAGAVSKPVTVKIRTGISRAAPNAVQIAKLVEDAGAAAIAVHGRSQQESYGAPADWGAIKAVKEAVSIPVIGNGDVFTPEQFAARLEESGVDAILLARGAIGNPGIFAQIAQLLRTGSYEPTDPLSLFSQYLRLAQRHGIGFLQVRSQAISFTKGAPQARQLRERLGRCGSLEELEAALAEARAIGTTL